MVVPSAMVLQQQTSSGRSTAAQKQSTRGLMQVQWWVFSATPFALTARLTSSYPERPVDYVAI
jgi:hypothetical protein